MKKILLPLLLLIVVVNTCTKPLHHVCISPATIGIVQGNQLVDLLLNIRGFDEANFKKLVNDEGANLLYAQDRSGKTPLVYAVIFGHIDLIKWLVKKKDVDIQKAIKKHGKTVLHWAATCNQLALAKWLVEEQGVDIRATDKFGKTALCCAVEGGHTDFVKWLVEEKCVDI